MKYGYVGYKMFVLQCLKSLKTATLNEFWQNTFSSLYLSTGSLKPIDSYLPNKGSNLLNFRRITDCFTICLLSTFLDLWWIPSLVLYFNPHN